MDRYRLRRVFDLGLMARRGPVTVTEARRSLDVPLSCTHDLVRALMAIDAGSPVAWGYTVGPRIVRLSCDITDSNWVPRHAQPHLKDLTQRTGLHVYLAARTGERVLYVARCPGHRQIIDIPRGRRLPLHSTAVGKLYSAFDRDVHQQMLAGDRPALTPFTHTTPGAIEADLTVIRGRGVSISRGESVVGVLGVAAPVWDARGRLAAAVQVSALQASLSPAQLEDVSVLLVATASRVQRELVTHQPPDRLENRATP